MRISYLYSLTLFAMAASARVLPGLRPGILQGLHLEHTTAATAANVLKHELIGTESDVQHPPHIGADTSETVAQGHHRIALIRVEVHIVTATETKIVTKTKTLPLPSPQSIHTTINTAKAHPASPVHPTTAVTHTATSAHATSAVASAVTPSKPSGDASGADPLGMVALHNEFRKQYGAYSTISWIVELLR